MPEDSPFSFASIQNAGDAPVMPDPPELQNLHQNLAQMRDFQVNSKLQADLSADPTAGLKSMKIKNDGTFQAEGSVQALQSLMKDRQDLNQIRGAFHQQAMQYENRARMQENQPPWVQLATSLAGNLATAPNMPGWVQALGRTSQELNPRADQLRGVERQIMGQEAGIAEKTAALDVSQLNHLQSSALRQETMANTLEQRRVGNVEHALDNLSQAISKGPGNFDPDSAAKILASAGASPREIGPKLEQLQTLASNVGKAFNISREDKLKAESLAREAEDRRAAQTNATIAAMNAKAADRSEADKAMDVAAQALANGDLTAIKDIASMRGDQRLRLFARAKELNPNFSTGQADMMKSFTVGKDGVALQSFDTFLQHAGEVTETLKGIQNTDALLLNRSLNWWRKNMAGSPELARLETSIEPVGKEFEKFLINNQALYADDRKQVNSLLNKDQPLSVTLATLNQMGKTAQDRFGAMNQRFKKTMGRDLTDVFSGGAQEGASKIGINLGTSASSGSAISKDDFDQWLKSKGGH